MKAIELKNITFGYNKEQPNIKGLTLSVDKGKYVSIIGHNGSSKSTLAKLIMGLIKPQDGEIYINGVLLNNDSIAKIREKMVIVFQNPDNQFIGATVEDDIAFGLENRRLPREEIENKITEYLSKVGMLKYREKEPSALSGGQKQRVALAGALSLNPEILILDEATAMLDPRGKREINELVLSMRKDNPNLTIVAITHDIEETLQSDEIFIMNNGELVLSTTPQELFTNKEILEKYHIDKPFSVALKDALKEKDINIDFNDMDEGIKALCRLK